MPSVGGTLRAFTPCVHATADTVDLPIREETTAAVLEVVRLADGVTTRHPLVGRRLVLGRSGDVDIRLDDDRVADCHAELRRCPLGGWWLHDHGSKCGTFVNGRRVCSHILSPGDTIAIANFAIHVIPTPARCDSEPPPSSSRITAKLDDDANRMALVNLRVDEWLRSSAAAVGALQLNAAVELEGHLMGAQTTRERREALCSWLVDPFGATQAQFVRLRRQDEAIILCGSTAEGAGTPHLSRSLLQALWNRRELVTATSRQRRNEDPGRTLLACPVREHDGTLDAVYVELSSGRGTEEGRALVEMVVSAYLHADTTSRMSSERRATASVEHELRTARQLQHRLFAKVDTYPDGLDVVMEYQPCMWVGGDYVDAVTLPDGRVLLVTADVCGKGLEGAMVASSLHTLVRATVDTGESLASLIERMNRYLCSHLPDHSYVTIAAVTLDATSGRFEHINAGHPPAMVCSQDGTLRPLQGKRNVALGMWPTPFELQVDYLAPGEILMLYTDGLSEADDGERDPTGGALWEAVARVVRADTSDPLTSLAHELMRRLRAGRDARFATDDAAFLLARWHGGRTAA